MPIELPEAEYPALVNMVTNTYFENQASRGLSLRKLPMRYKALMQAPYPPATQAQLDITFLRNHRSPPGGGDALHLFLDGLSDQLADDNDLATLAYLRAILTDPDARPADRVLSAIAALPGAGLVKDKVGQLERVLHESPNFLPIRFLQLGIERAKAVVKILGPSGDLGTGFLVEPGWLVTNHHVWRNEATARASTLLFGYELGLDGAVHDGERVAVPATGEFRTSPTDGGDDLTALRLPPGITQRGTLPAITAIDTRLDASVPIIQHPLGTPKQIVLTDAKVTSILPGQRIRYTSDTDRGSSGSPVFDMNWDLVAVHHASLAVPDEPDRPVRNEGIHVSRLIALLA